VQNETIENNKIHDIESSIAQRRTRCYNEWIIESFRPAVYSCIFVQWWNNFAMRRILSLIKAKMHFSNFRNIRCQDENPDNWNEIKLWSWDHFQVLRRNLQAAAVHLLRLRRLYDYTIKCTLYECVWIKCDVNEVMYANIIRTMAFSVTTIIPFVLLHIDCFSQYFSILWWLKKTSPFLFLLYKLYKTE